MYSSKPGLLRVNFGSELRWFTASGRCPTEDLRYARVEGRRPFWLPWLQRYTHRVFRLTGASAPDYDRLLRVFHLLARPPLLFHPATLARVAGFGR